MKYKEFSILSGNKKSKKKSEKAPSFWKKIKLYLHQQG